MEQAPVESGARILVVDDSFANRDLLQRRLEQEGYLVETAASGEAALAHIAHACPESHSSRRGNARRQRAGGLRPPEG